MKEKSIVSSFLIGVIFNVVISTVYPCVLSPIVICYFKNQFLSYLFLWLTSMVLFYIVIWLYDKTKIDWILIESLKEAQENNTEHTGESRLIRLIVYWTKKSKFFLFIYLIVRDPVLAVIYYRKGYRKWDGLNNKKNFSLFILSTLLYTLTTTGLVSVVLNWIMFFAKKL